MCIGRTMSVPISMSQTMRSCYVNVYSNVDFCEWKNISVREWICCLLETDCNKNI
jgi:DNA primase catalytic subunit